MFLKGRDTAVGDIGSERWLRGLNNNEWRLSRVAYTETEAHDIWIQAWYCASKYRIRITVAAQQMPFGAYKARDIAAGLSANVRRPS